MLRERWNIPPWWFIGEAVRFAIMSILPAESAPGETSGEMPYTIECDGGGRPHFLCYQYNAFELLDLAHYYSITDDAAVLPIMEKLATFIAHGITE